MWDEKPTVVMMLMLVVAILLAIICFNVIGCVFGPVKNTFDKLF